MFDSLSLDVSIENYPIYTLKDLEKWSFKGRSFAVIGHPIQHSLSPILHNTAFRILAGHQDHFKDYRYFRFDIEPNCIQEALRQFYEKEFIGLNITAPYKLAAFEHAKVHDETALEAGCANTLLHTQKGYKAYNTDGYGFIRALEVGLRTQVTDQSIVILGAGGAARSAAIRSLKAGCQEIWIGNRSRERLFSLVHEVLQPLRAEEHIHTFLFNDYSYQLPSGALLINATTLGRIKTDTSPLLDAQLPSAFKVLDMNYGPFKSTFIRRAEARGYPFVDGLLMLVYQAEASLKLWTQHSLMPVQAMLQAVQSIVNP